MARGPGHSRPQARPNPVVERRQKPAMVADIVAKLLGFFSDTFHGVPAGTELMDWGARRWALKVAQVVKGDAALEIIYRKQASSGVVMHRKRLLGCVGAGLSAWLEWVEQQPRDLPQTF